MIIEILDTSHNLADRLQRARHEASDLARTSHVLRTYPRNPALWLRLRHAVRRVS